MSLISCTISRKNFASLAICAGFLFCAAAHAQPHSESEVSREMTLSMLPVTEPEAIAEWLTQLVGKFKYDGILQVGPDVRPISGNSDCKAVGHGPGVQCILNVTWDSDYPLISRGSTARDIKVSYLDPAMELYGIDPGKSAINHLVVNNKGLPEGGLGHIKGDTATFKMPCVNDDGNEGPCFRAIRIEARRDSDLVFMWFGFTDHEASGMIDIYATMSLRRMPDDWKDPTVKRKK